MSFLHHLTHLFALLRWRAALVVLMLGVSGCLEGAGLLLLLPLLGAIGLDIQQGSVGALASWVVMSLARLQLPPTLPVVLVLFVVVNVASALVRRAHTLLGVRLEQDVVRSTTERLYEAVLRMNWLAFSRLRGSDVTVALTTESERTGMAASQLLLVSASMIVTAVYVGLALRVSVALTSGVFTAGLLLLLLMRRRTARAAELGAVHADAVREFHGSVTDDLAGMKTIRSFVAEDRSLSRFRTLAHRLTTTRIRSAQNYATATFWLEVGSVCVLSLLVFIAVTTLRFTPAGLLMLLFLFGRIVPRLTSLQQNLQFYANILPSCERVAALEARCRAAADASPVPAAAVSFTRRIQLDSIVFHYSEDAPPVLSGLNLTVDAGTTVALVGSSGAGKTTVADVMMGLLTPQHGRVLIDDRPVDAGAFRAWRETMAYVSQDTFLFHDSIRANLRWAAPSATDEAMADALVTASADFALALPAGLDTIVGDRGARLSGGERQRIALARAILRRPSLLVLDEATSAIDAENEARILEAIGRLHGSMTILIITHRLSALANTDLVHRLEGGRIVESGPWPEIAANAGLARDFSGALTAAAIPS